MIRIVAIVDPGSRSVVLRTIHDESNYNLRYYVNVHCNFYAALDGVLHPYRSRPLELCSNTVDQLRVAVEKLCNEFYGLGHIKGFPDSAETPDTMFWVPLFSDEYPGVCTLDTRVEPVSDKLNYFSHNNGLRIVTEEMTARLAELETRLTKIEKELAFFRKRLSFHLD